jgi:hypothetical protein
MRRWQFSCEARPDIPLPPEYSFPQAFNYLNPENNSFYVLEQEGVGYIQCGGGKSACTVEVREYRPDGGYVHYVVGHSDGESVPATVQVSRATVTVEKRDVLTHWEAIELFKCYFEQRPFPERFQMREIPI